jgi:hypothetical protein
MRKMHLQCNKKTFLLIKRVSLNYPPILVGEKKTNGSAAKEVFMEGSGDLCLLYGSYLFDFVTDQVTLCAVCCQLP